MSSTEDLSKIKGQVPVSVIVNGGNYISYLLAKTQLDGLSMRYAQLLQRIAAKSHLRFNTINTVINTDTR